MKEMLSVQINQPSQSAYNSPIVIVKKKDGSQRFCVDYRKINATTEDQPFILPNLHVKPKVRILVDPDGALSEQLRRALIRCILHLKNKIQQPQTIAEFILSQQNQMKWKACCHKKIK